MLLSSGESEGMRILALDYGDKTIGVAVSDPRGIVAIGVETIRRAEELGLKKSMRRLEELVLMYGVDEMVLGYPKRMDNSEGQRCEKTKAFKRKLESRFKGMPVVLWDERFSTIGAMRGLESMPKSKADLVVDTMAAVFILQGYLDLKNSQREEAIKLDKDDNIFDESDDLEEEYDTLSLVNDDGETENFYIVDSIDEDGSRFLLVAPQDQPEREDGEYDLTIIRQLPDNGSEESEYEDLEDEEEFDKIAAIFKSRNPIEDEDFDV
jgi:putative Holliday junction resolvase